MRDELNRRTVLGGVLPARPETLAAFSEAWLQRCEQRVRPATAEAAKRSLGHLAPFADRSIESLTAHEIDDHIHNLATRTPRTAELTLDTLKLLLRNATQRGQRADVGILALRAPARDRAEMQFLTWSKVEALAEEVLEPYDLLVRFACLTGLRQGEIFALRASRVHLDQRFLIVDAGARNGQLVPTKTRAGKRRVGLTRNVAALLGAQLALRPESGEDLVFPSPAGMVWRKDNFMSRIFRPAVRRAGLQPLRFHDLRHTYAALMVQAGAHPKLLQAQLGHTSIGVTLNTYGHLFPDAFKDVGDVLDDLTRANRGSTGVAASPSGLVLSREDAANG